MAYNECRGQSGDNTDMTMNSDDDLDDDDDTEQMMAEKDHRIVVDYL